ncbi:MAG: UDP-N-acetylmuramoyl-L-alanine--D-glutamate ligase [Clostridia bacterium]|nr:UDP-N-acetylmuramoyl-L-alanine--D-glutamate ligase [Clostridia bacterium]
MIYENTALERFAALVAGKRVAVIGVGISNRPLIDMLLGAGAIVTARDRKTREKFPAADELEALGVTLILGEEYLEDIDEDILFKAPGIRSDKPELKAALERGAMLTSEMEVFFELCPAHIFAITGSDGKTTTTTLTAKLLEAAGHRVFLGGNIGRPLLPLVGEMTPDDFAVVELSSFQLHCMKQSPEVALITNVSPNHLDWHTGMDEYIEAKKTIFRHQREDMRLVLNYENEITREMAKEAAAEVTYFGHNTIGEPQHAHEVIERDGVISLDGERILDCDDILIPGRHNAENYMAAIAATAGYVSPEVVRELASSFGGVEHRCEFVRELDGVRYYNSSIDSSPTRTAAALSSFKSRVIVICGGYDKQIPFEPLGYTLSRHAKTAVLTGATAGKIKEALIACPEYSAGLPEIIEAGCFEGAVEAARAAAVPGDVVILSPACASFDAFANFEERGNRYKEIVRNF